VDTGADDGAAGMSGTAGAAGFMGGSAGSSPSGGTGNGGSLPGGAGAGALGPGGAGSGGAGGTFSGGAGGSIGGAGLGGGGAAGASSGEGGGGAGAIGGNAGGGAGGAGASGAGAGGRGGAPNGGRGGAGNAGGGTSGGGNGGAGGSSGLSPCPATGPCKILPLGDSITDGIGFSGGYRVSLFSRAVAASKSITFVGRSMNGPTMVSGQPFPRSHEGHSGWTIAQIDGITPDPALDPVPHIVLLHIGTNDVSAMGSGAPMRLGALIDQIVAELPNALLVVAKIIPFPGAASQVNTFNAAVPGVVQERANAGKHVILVDQFTGFPTSELGDGVHPNEAGYTRMAGVWFTAISSYLH
jgi:hypothetical protein